MFSTVAGSSGRHPIAIQWAGYRRPPFKGKCPINYCLPQIPSLVLQLLWQNIYPRSICKRKEKEKTQQEVDNNNEDKGRNHSKSQNPWWSWLCLTWQWSALLTWYICLHPSAWPYVKSNVCLATRTLQPVLLCVCQCRVAECFVKTLNLWILLRVHVSVCAWWDFWSPLT